MYPEFAYTQEMQFILAVIAFISAYFFLYLIANLTLQLYGEKATSMQKSVFAFLIGGILNTAWSYAIYFIGGMRSFSSLVYALVVTPNPIFAMLYYLIGVKVLKLSPVRSIKIMGHVYMYYIIIKSFNRLLASIFFVMPPGRYNYMLDAIKNLVLFAVILIAYFATKKILEHNKYTINLNLFLNSKRELVIYFSKATFIYLMMVVLPLFISEKIAANFVIFLIFLLTFASTILWDMYISTRNDVENRAAHISLLSRGVLSGNEADIRKLGKKINENPSFVSILINKYDYAEKMKVKMSMELQGRLEYLNIDNVDACVVVACLLDNAIEAAASSEQKRVSFTVESKGDGGKLIIINNSTAIPIDTNKILFHGITNKAGHKSRGLAVVRKIISKYGNCAFQLTYNNYEMSAYLEMKQNHLFQHLLENNV